MTRIMTLAYVTVVDLAARDLEQGGTCVPRVVRVNPGTVFDVAARAAVIALSNTQVF